MSFDIDSYADENPDSALLKADGWDDCCLGVVSRCGSPDILCYSVDQILEKMIRDEGMSHEDAREHFDFNIAGSYVGELTPCFLETPE